MMANVLLVGWAVCLCGLMIWNFCMLLNAWKAWGGADPVKRIKSFADDVGVGIEVLVDLVEKRKGIPDGVEVGDPFYTDEEWEWIAWLEAQHPEYRDWLEEIAVKMRESGMTADEFVAVVNKVAPEWSRRD